MKRHFCLLNLAIILLVTSACSSNSLEANSLEATCEKADNYVATWNVTEDSSYEGTYDEDSDSYIVVVELGRSIYNDLDDRDNTWTLTTYLFTEAIQSKYYPELKELFADFDTDVLVGVKDCNGNLTCIIENDKILDAR